MVASSSGAVLQTGRTLSSLWGLPELANLVRGALERIIGGPLDMLAPLLEYGIDSIAWVECGNALNFELGIDVDISVLMECDCAETLIRTLHSMTSAMAVAPAPVQTVAIASVVLTRTLLPPPASSPLQPLFLGAPAFGDGQLAYMRLATALREEVRGGAQPIVTLERDENTPWPLLAAAHALQVAEMQPTMPFLLGGHSLGGLLAIQTARLLEEAGRTVGVVFLVDSPHPIQFKAEWTDEVAAQSGSVSEQTEAKRQHALQQLEIMMRSIAFDFDEVGWAKLNSEEKLQIFAGANVSTHADPYA
jgi:hypothetical protein